MHYNKLKAFPENFLWGASTSAYKLKAHIMKMVRDYQFKIQKKLLKVQLILR